MLKQQRIAAKFRIENPKMRQPLEPHQRQRDRQHRSPQDEYHARGIRRPDEQWQPEPGQPRGPHSMDRYDEIQAGQYRGESCDENPDYRGRYAALRALTAVRRIES